MEVRTDCHPQAVGRVGDNGTEVFFVRFVLEGGGTLTVHMGERGWETFRRQVYGHEVRATANAALDAIFPEVGP